MMMTKSKPDEGAKKSEASASNSSGGVHKKLDAVADLERRLADLTVPEQPAAAAAPAFAAPPAAAAAAAAPPATTAASGSKNALLARIMAAQERAKQTQGGTPKQQAQQHAPPPVFDFLDSNSSTSKTPPPPPPAFDSSLLPPPPQSQAPPPPAFDASFLPPPLQEDSKPAAASSMMMFDPMAVSARPHMMAPPSAPAFEDLMDTMSLPTPTNTHTVVMPPPSQQHHQHQQTTSDSSNCNVLDDEALQAILGIEGLTEAEKQEMIAEQIKIMQAIQDSKQSSQVSAADAFEARSFSAAVQSIGQTSNRLQLHGQERTREAIQEGTAIKVQCPSCQNWMQVTGTAQLMFCPVCQTVSPVQGAAGLTPEEADQLAADARLAEQLQKEEYESAERQEAQQQQQRESKKKSSTGASAAPASQSQGWMEWLGFGTPATAPASPAHREIRTTHSTDSTEGLLSGGNVAKPQPHLFACVTDSIGAAVNYATALPQDEEGNVHGVDASSLLAVTQVGRQQQNDHESDQRYDRQLD